MNFNEAIKACKAGARIMRAGWTDKTMVYLRWRSQLPSTSFAFRLQQSEPHVEVDLMLCTTGGDVVPWTVSHADALADDWSIFAEHPIILGSLNPAKLEAVRRVLGPQATAIAAASGVREQPMSLSEILSGAGQRAEEVFKIQPEGEPLWAVGIESGVYMVADMYGGERMFDVTACVIARGAMSESGVFYLAKGFSSAWEVPVAIAMRLKAGNGTVTMDQVLLERGLTTDPRLGYGQGAIGLLTGGTMTRTSCAEEAIRAALVKTAIEDNAT